MAIDSVDAYIAIHERHTVLLNNLRAISLELGLEEHVKWGAPVYSFHGKNIIGLGVFKNHSGIWFLQGVFLKDEEKLLINAQNGKTQAMRQWRINHGEKPDLDKIKMYLLEAIENQKAGMVLPHKKNTDFIESSHLELTFINDPELRNSFESLSPGKRKEYHEYINDAKQENTKIRRLEKIIPMIKTMVGLNDKYRK